MSGSSFSIRGQFDGGELIKGLGQVKEGLGNIDKTAGEAKESLGQMLKEKNSTSNYKRQLQSLSKELQDLLVNYRLLSDEDKNSDFGRNMSARIDELTQKAALYKDAIMDAQASIQRAASDTANWDAVKQGIDTASSALQAFIGVSGLSEDSTEALVAVLAKLKAAEAATAAVIKVGNALQKESALMQGIAKVQALASAAATKADTAAKSGNIVATKSATAAQAALNAVAKANPYILLASAIAAVGTALVAFCKKSKEAKDSINDLDTAVNSSKDTWKDYWDKISEKNKNEGKSQTEIELEALNREMAVLEAFQKNWAKSGHDYFKENAEEGKRYEQGLIRRAALEKKIAEEKKTNKVTSPATDSPVAGSIAEIESRLSKLQKLQKETTVTGTEEWIELENQINKVTSELESAKLMAAAFRGELIDIPEIKDIPIDIDDDIKIDTTDHFGNLIDAYKKLAEAEAEFKSSSLDAVQSGLGTFSSIASTISSAMETFSDPDTTGWEKFLTTINLANSALGTYQSIMSIINTLELANTSLKQASAAASLEEASANGAKAATASAAAVAGGASSVASIPFVGPALAVAAAAAIITGILAATSKANKLKKYANGGIVSGSSFFGDMNVARVNSGEMILNSKQQENLWKFINNDHVTSTQPAQVEFKIKGAELVGAINNYNKRRGKA